jgi:hypothetical protein
MPPGPAHFYRSVQVSAEEAHVIELLRREAVERTATPAAEAAAETAHASPSSALGVAARRPASSGGRRRGRLAQPTLTGWRLFLETETDAAQEAAATKAAALATKSQLADRWQRLGTDRYKGSQQSLTRQGTQHTT